MNLIHSRLQYNVIPSKKYTLIIYETVRYRWTANCRSVLGHRQRTFRIHRYRLHTARQHHEIAPRRYVRLQQLNLVNSGHEIY